MDQAIQWLLVLQWFGGIILALSSLVGFAKLAEIWFTRRLKQKDLSREMHESNQAKQIDFDVVAFNAGMQQIKDLQVENKNIRDELKSMNEKLFNQGIHTAKVESENTHVKETNERQEMEIKELRGENLKQAHELTGLKLELSRTQGELATTVKQFETLKCDFEKFILEKK